MPSQGKKKTTPLLILNMRFTKLTIHHLKTKHNIHPRTGSLLHYSHEDNVLGNLRSVEKDGREVFEEEVVPKSSAPKVTKVTEPKAAMQTKPSVPKATKVTKPAGHVAKKRKSKSPLKLVDKFVDEGPARLVVFREPDSGRFQLLPEGGSDLGKAREVMKIAEVEQTTEERIHEEFTFIMYPNVQDNLKLPVEEHVILEEPTSSIRTLSSLHHLDKDFNFGDQFLNDKSSDVEKDKTHAEVEVESMVTVTIQQDTSSVSLMTFKVVDLPRTRPDDPMFIHLYRLQVLL
nr:hypothetical protein [Tanacetum cinerariifolium]